MPLFYRIQPEGLEIVGHRSEANDGEQHDGIDVFSCAEQTLAPDVRPEDYGDEVIVIHASHSPTNGDVEGCRIDPETSTVVRRYPWPEWVDLMGGEDAWPHEQRNAADELEEQLAAEVGE